MNEAIGRGGMGIVYRATQLKVGREVAVKVMSGACTETQIARFRRETDVVAKLRHPNTLTLFDAGVTAQGHLFLVSELLRGRTLLDALQSGPIDVDRSLRIARDICGSLQEAHVLGIVHRDLKPANIFLVPVGNEEVAKVLDFGIATVLTDSPELTAEGRRIGTPAYMSPEQISGRKLDGRSDLYALGVIMYQCLSGAHPFPEAESYPQAHLHDTPTSLRSTASGLRVPEALEALIMQLLEKSPEDRVSTAEDLAIRINAILDRQVTVTQDPATQTGQAEIVEPQAPATNPWPKRAAAGLAVAAMSLGGWALVGSQTKPQGPMIVQIDSIVPSRLRSTISGQEKRVRDAARDCAERAQILGPTTVRIMVDGAKNWVSVRPKGEPADRMQACMQSLSSFVQDSDELLVLTLTIRR